MGNHAELKTEFITKGQLNSIGITDRKIRRRIAQYISVLPFGALRIFFYRNLFGYQINKSHIGKKVLIDVDFAELSECSIGKGNQFLGPMRIKIKKGVVISERNRFICPDWTKQKKFKSANFKRYLEVGVNCGIAFNHHFDIAGSIIVGDGSKIAGQGSQFWTHGAGIKDRDIRIGRNCYIGSAVRFAPGTSIGDNCVVSLGSVVVKKINSQNALIGGQPAKILRESYNWHSFDEKN